MWYHPTQVWEENLTPAVIEHLDENPTVTVTGTSHRRWKENRKIGKTTTVKNRLVPKLRREGLTVSYLDLQKLMQRFDQLGHTYFMFEHLLMRARKMRPADVYVLDEIHHIFPYKNGVTHYRTHDEIYRKAVLAFWEMLSSHLEHGGKIVYVTAVHPFYSAYRNGADVNAAMSTFFISPVIELSSRIY